VPEFGGGQDRRDPAAPPHQGSPPPSSPPLPPRSCTRCGTGRTPGSCSGPWRGGPPRNPAGARRAPRPSPCAAKIGCEHAPRALQLPHFPAELPP
jgi:hypothetical protein